MKKALFLKVKKYFIFIFFHQILKHGDKIDFNITISPQASSYIGLYNRNTGLCGFPSESLSSTGWNGNLVVNGDGKYSLAFDNVSNIKARYTGTYTL